MKKSSVEKETLTELGLYLAKRSVNRAEVSRKTRLSTYRLSQLSINPTTQLRADELYLIALAIGEDPGIMFKSLFRNLSLPNGSDINIPETKADNLSIPDKNA